MTTLFRQAGIDRKFSEETRPNSPHMRRTCYQTTTAHHVCDGAKIWPFRRLVLRFGSLAGLLAAFLKSLSNDKVAARYRPTQIFLLLVVLYSSATASPLAAQTTYSWSPPFPPTGSFGSSANWSPGGGPPGELDTAVFNTGAALTTTFNYSPVNASLQHQSGNTIFRPSGTNATYSLNGASTISGGSLTINPDGIFKLDVRFSGLTLLGNSTFNIYAGEVSNAGVLNVGNGSAATINIDGSTAKFNSAYIGQNTLGGSTNGHGTLTFSNGATGSMAGSLRIGGDLYNHAGGIVELESGKRLTFTDNISNLAGGRITGRGQMVAAQIDNYGQMLFSGGFTDIQAPITGYSGSQMILTGGSTTTVLGDVEIRGGAELRISEFSNGVFFDHVQLRDGALLTGDGNAFFEGSLGIGNSPSRQEFNLNVTLGATSELIMEIAGTDPYLPAFDQFVFLKNLSLQGGALTVDLIGLNEGDPNYLPLAGDSFRFIEVSGNWTGTFGTLNLPTLADGLTWNTTQLYSHGSLSVSAIPEPGSGLMLIAMAAAFVLRRHRRTMGALQ